MLANKKSVSFHAFSQYYMVESLYLYSSLCEIRLGYGSSQADIICVCVYKRWKMKCAHNHRARTKVSERHNLHDYERRLHAWFSL